MDEFIRIGQYIFYEYNYVLLMIPAIIFAMIAQFKVKSTFNKYSQVPNSRNITGAEAARQVLMANGISDVRIEPVSGSLTDHYDPSQNVIRLSESVYGSNSVAAIGVACHEAGHAVQYAKSYAPIHLRAAVIPMTRIGSYLAMPLIIIGMLFSFLEWLAVAGVVLYSFAVIFQLITVPVEYDASARAMRAIKENNLLSEEEQKYAKKTLSAAALTYVAALASALVSFLRLLLIVRRGSNKK